MKVEISISHGEICEYGGFLDTVPESEYQEIIQNDIKIILENAGFQTITMDDITVNITNA